MRGICGPGRPEPRDPSPIGLIHEHSGPVDTFHWEGGRVVCGECRIPVEIVMIERRLTEYTIREK